MVLDYTAFILIWGLDNTKRNWVHNDAGSYQMSSVVLICGSYSTQWHPVSVMQSWSVTILPQVLLRTVGARMHFAKQFN